MIKMLTSEKIKSATIELKSQKCEKFGIVKIVVKCDER